MRCFASRILWIYRSGNKSKNEEAEDMNVRIEGRGKRMRLRNLQWRGRRDMLRNDQNSRYQRRIWTLVVACLFLLVVILYSITSGTIDFSLYQVSRVLLGLPEERLAVQVIWNVRLPRVLTGMLVGMNLAVAGSLLQGVLRNPMASPNIIGVNAGAGLAAVTMMVIAPTLAAHIPLAAFIGALFAALLIYLLSMKQSGAGSTVHLVLAGVAISSFFSALTSGVMILNADELDVTYGWLLGSLSGRSWPYVSLLLPYSIVGLLLAFLISPKANIFALGDEIGTSIGVSIRWYRFLIIAIAAVLAGSAVSAGGTIGFVGLVAPHIARILIGTDYRFQIPMAALLGGSLLVSADTFARTVFQPLELSVGVVTSVIGAPFFLYLLYRRRKLGSN